MSMYVFSNNVQSTLASSVTSTATTITLASNANFPTIPAGYVWAVTLNDAATQKVFEIVYVTGTSGANLTGCLRGQEGTTAQAWLANDKAFAADTAGILGSFINSTAASGYVALNPATQQSGAINISGNASIGGDAAVAGTFSIGGALINATTGAFSGQVTAPIFASSAAYNSGTNALVWISNPSIGNGTTGIAADSAFSAAGVVAEEFFVSVGGIGATLAVDRNLNVGVGGGIVANSNIVSLSGAMQALLMEQNGTQVVSSLTSSTLTLTRSGANYEVEIPPQMMIGGRFANLSNGGNPTITLPNYGSWFIEVFYGVQQVTNTNMTVTLALTGGTITNEWLTNANGHTAFNAQSIILVYGRGFTNVNNQTLTFTLTATGGTLDPSNQPWTVWATRTA